MEVNSQSPGISVIICCFNSSQRLPQTLACLSRQKLPESFHWEIIVIDNASTDETAVVAKEKWKENGISFVPLVIAYQGQPGLMYARQKGIEISSYNLILFCDDDNHLSPDYVSSAFRLMEEKKEVYILGGYAKPKLPFYPGKWIEDLYSALAIGRQAEKDSYVNWVYGAGMVVRKSIFDELKRKGIEFLLSGRKGGKQTFGEDSEICLLTKLLGHKVYYSTSLELDHAISVNRLRKMHFINANYKNVFPLVVLFLIEKVIENKEVLEKKLYKEKLKTSVSMIFFFLPRCFLGKHQFYSFIMLLQNTQLALWMLLRRDDFAKLFFRIRRNIA